MKELAVHLIRTETVRRYDWKRLESCMPRRFEKAMRYRQERDRLLCLGAGILLMEVLGVRDEKEIRYGQYGKPCLPGGPAFSLSHSGDLCLLACGDDAPVTQGEVSPPSTSEKVSPHISPVEVSCLGADLEEIDERHLDLAKAVLTEKELAWMQKDPLERFFRLWTLKESLMKATGLGMNLPPGSFEVLPLAEGKPATILGRCWYAWEGQADQCRISVCTEEPFEKVRVSVHSEFEAGG